MSSVERVCVSVAIMWRLTLIILMVTDTNGLALKMSRSGKTIDINVLVDSEDCKKSQNLTNRLLCLHKNDTRTAYDPNRLQTRSDEIEKPVKINYLPEFHGPSTERFTRMKTKHRRQSEERTRRSSTESMLKTTYSSSYDLDPNKISISLPLDVAQKLLSKLIPGTFNNKNRGNSMRRTDGLFSSEEAYKFDKKPIAPHKPAHIYRKGSRKNSEDCEKPDKVEVEEECEKPVKAMNEECEVAHKEQAARPTSNYEECDEKPVEVEVSTKPAKTTKRPRTTTVKKVPESRFRNRILELRDSLLHWDDIGIKMFLCVLKAEMKALFEKNRKIEDIVTLDTRELLLENLEAMLVMTETELKEELVAVNEANWLKMMQTLVDKSYNAKTEEVLTRLIHPMHTAAEISVKLYKPLIHNAINTIAKQLTEPEMKRLKFVSVMQEYQRGLQKEKHSLENGD